MKKSIAPVLIVAFLLTTAITSFGAQQQENPKQTLRHSFLCSDIGAKRVFKISAAGEIEWEYPADQCTDAWLLPSGNVLMSFTGKKRGAREVTPDKKIVWQYETDSEVWGCQRFGQPGSHCP